MSDWHPSAQILSDFVEGRLSDALGGYAELRASPISFVVLITTEVWET